MDDRDARLLRAIEAAERELRGGASIDSMAEAACWSRFHFERVFNAVLGDTPGAYLRKRRLSAARDEALAGGRPLIDIALDYGYESPGAFSRAFAAQFGAPPSKIRTRGLAALPGIYPALDAASLARLSGGGTSMEPRIIERGPIALAGMECACTAKKNGIPRLWGAFIKKALKAPGFLDGGTYGVYIYDFGKPKAEVSEDEAFTYLAACERSASLPKGMVERTLPRREYAVFEHRGPLAELALSYRQIFGVWFPKAGREALAAEHFEYHGPDFKGDGPDAVTEIWIPLKP